MYKLVLETGLEEGEYRIIFFLGCRLHAHFNCGINILAGREFVGIELPIKVTANRGVAPVKFIARDVEPGNTMPLLCSSFEEFMTSFKIYQGAERLGPRQEETIYLQVAPWTSRVVAKLISSNPKRIAVAKIPIQISNETLKIKYNPVI